MKISVRTIPYQYRHASVPGGGFVTGFVFHPKSRQILYARTDIGGVYRYQFAEKHWISLMDHVRAPDRWESYPLSIALDPRRPERLYIAAGDLERNYLCRSDDKGAHFQYFPLPAAVHGNHAGRATGERLIVDPVCSDILYFASQSEGLLISEDAGETWRSLPVGQHQGQAEPDLSFIWIHPDSAVHGRSQIIVVSTAGAANANEQGQRGPSLFWSVDGGAVFRVMPGQPQPPSDFGNYPGFVGQRCSFDGTYLYVTLAAVGHSWAGWSGYACDMGGRQRGCVMRYRFAEDGTIADVRFITPDLSFLTGETEVIEPHAGFGGIAADPARPGHLICSTQCFDPGDVIFYSDDSGLSWRPALHDLSIGRMDFTGVPYMKPQYNGGHNLIHWLSDLKIDPFDRDRAVFNTGTGIFMTENLTAADRGDEVVWRPSCQGLEETVHLNVYSPPAGPVQLLDIIGDLGGFAFTNLNQPAENSFADAEGNRYITCLNADFTDDCPRYVAVTARGNWKGKTTGGLIWSEDYGQTWSRLPDPTGLSPRIDQLIAAIRQPNTNSGWTALSADHQTLVWCVGEGNRLPADAVVVSDDLGKTWRQSRLYGEYGQILSDCGLTCKVFADRVEPERFYAFGNDSSLYVSDDRARSFRRIHCDLAFPRLELGGMDGNMPAEIRLEAGQCGVVWIAAAEGGLWRLTLNARTRQAVFERRSAEGDIIYRQGMGCPLPGRFCQTLYVNGFIQGIYGFYRSADEGVSWERINDERQMFGDIRSICGDPRQAGRFYLATGSRGVLWGQPLVPDDPYGGSAER